MFKILAKHGVDCIVIGGTAAYLQGSPLPTEDLDIVPAKARENLARLSKALNELKAEIGADGVAGSLPFRHDADSLAAAQMWNLSTKHGDLDITFEPSGTDGYADLAKEALTVSILGVEVRLASLTDIVRSKEAADRDKDRRALPILRDLLDQQVRERRPK